MSSDPPKPAEAAPAKTAPEEVPDPDEDDLSDLDDVLDEFAATKLDSKPAPTSSGPGRPATSTAAAAAAAAGGISIGSSSGHASGIPASAGAPLPAPGLLPDDDEFARQLQAGMADLLGELETNPEMQKQFEQLVKELGEASAMAADGQPAPSAPSASRDAAAGAAAAAATASATATAAASSSAPDQKKVEDDFQEQVRRTMERMRVSGESASAAAQSASADDDDFLAQMLREMEKGGAGGLGSDEDFSRMLMGMMEQLTNKDILYEPMKELDGKFPGWLNDNKDKVAKADLERYETQRTLVREIVAKFEEAGYADDKVDCREYIVDRMQKV